MLGLKHHCPVCGMDVEKETGPKRFGKYFCSEEHARQYAERRTEEISSRDDEWGRGCC